MIVDVHTRVWQSADQLGEVVRAMHRRRPEPWNRPDATTESHRTALDAVDAAIVHGLRINRLGAHIPADVIRDYVKSEPDRLLGFGGIDPSDGCGVKQLEEALNMGLVGVTINPAAQGYHPADTRAMALYEACADKGVPILIDSRGSLVAQASLEFAQPVLFDEALRRFDGLRLWFGSIAFPFTESCFAMMMKHESVFADLVDQLAQPWMLYNALVHAHQFGVLDRLMFGSGFPFATAEQAMVAIYSANTLAKGTQLPLVPREQLRSIVERDALSCLGLQDKLKTRPASAKTLNSMKDQPA